MFGSHTHQALIYPSVDTIPPYQRSMREENRIHRSLVFSQGEVSRFVGKGKAPCKRGPGDSTGTSLAFSFYDFAIGAYRYRI